MDVNRIKKKKQWQIAVRCLFLQSFLFKKKYYRMESTERRSKSNEYIKHKNQIIRIE